MYTEEKLIKAVMLW